MKLFLLFLLFVVLINCSIAEETATATTTATEKQEEETCDDDTMPAITSTTTLVVGATGATGKHVVQMLLDKGQKVRTVVRSKERMEGLLTGDYGDRLEVTEASLLDLPQQRLEELTRGCDAVVSCLGHNMDFKGLFGQPRKLVTEATSRLTSAIGTQKTKFILMGSNGVANPNGNDDERTFVERAAIFLLQWLVPPVADNEAAALYLHEMGGTGPEWCVIRPDDLIDAEVSEYDLLTKPKLGLFGAGLSTRANVAHSMVELILNDDEWQKWKFQMPVLNNVLIVEEAAKK
jgi:nitrous oxide reductase accessory protein NosL